MRFLDLIAKKRDGGRHSPAELELVARAAAEGLAPDYQLSAWLMAVVCRGMDEEETVALTRAMADSGRRLSFRSLRRPVVDKHSTGGVGDGVSLALAPLAAACGLAVPMMSGRGLGHTGGTLDKLESVPGLKTRLPPARVRRQMRALGACMFGQSADLAPADRVLYALRDATATVPARPLVVSSILSKKAAEGLDALVLDVKVGSGAIFRDRSEARALARALVRAARGLGMRAAAVLTDMDQPLGRYIGNALEMRQAVEILRGSRTAEDYRGCLLALGGWMLHLGGLAPTPREGARRMEARIADGSGLALFRRIVAAQGGDPACVDEPGRLPRARLSRPVRAARAGFVRRLDALAFGRAAVELGAGRAFQEQALDYGAGVELLRKAGEPVRRGEPVALLLAQRAERLDAAEAELSGAVELSARAPRPRPVVLEIVR